MWLKLESWKETKDGSFLYANVLASGKFTAPCTGIYFFTANVIFHDANGPISVLISLNDVTSKRKSLFATNGNPSAIEETINLSGPLYIQKGKCRSANVINLITTAFFKEKFVACVRSHPRIFLKIVKKVSYL